MEPVPRTSVLATHSVRRRVVRDEAGDVHLFGGSFSLGMNLGEFVELAGMLAEATDRRMRCGEDVRGCCGWVTRCAMGQILVSHGNLTLWFSPEEFEDLYRLTASARRRLADTEPPPSGYLGRRGRTGSATIRLDQPRPASSSCPAIDVSCPLLVTSRASW
jgi:hypothetical protein